MNNKHAYLIGAYHNYNVLQCCIKMIDDIRNDIYIHIDRKELDCFPKNEISSLVKHSRLYFVPSINVRWAHVSQIQLVLLLLECATETSQYAYYHFLQGADLPIKKQDDIHTFFNANPNVQYIDLTFGSEELASYKANFYHFFVGFPGYRNIKALKYADHLLAHIQKWLHIFRNRRHLYFGSGLFSITHAYAIDLLSRKAQLLKTYRFTLSCDEVFLQTDIMNSRFKDTLAAPYKESFSNSRFIDWNRRTGNSPYTFRTTDLNLLLSQPEGICFARKFDEQVDYEIAKILCDLITS